jgi:hypothetical protein
VLATSGKAAPRAEELDRRRRERDLINEVCILDSFLLSFLGMGT